jgi:hypothetical protein
MPEKSSFCKTNAGEKWFFINEINHVKVPFGQIPDKAFCRSRAAILQNEANSSRNGARFDLSIELRGANGCPPASWTIDALRRVLLGWMGETVPPFKTVLCTPSKAIETWVLVALFPQNQFAASADAECRANPGARLQAGPKARRLIRSGKKDVRKYRESAIEIAEAWPRVRRRCTEAERFSVEFLSALG